MPQAPVESLSLSEHLPGEILVPVDDYILVELIPDDMEEKVGDLVIPRQQATRRKRRPERGRVLALGPGLSGREPQEDCTFYSVGDVLYFSEFAGYSVQVGNREYQLIRRDEVACKIQPAPRR